jgi:phosphate starvation-inducible PhoH-like protein
MQKIITISDFEELLKVLGPRDENIKKLASEFDVKIWERGNNILIDGPAEKVKTVEKIIRNILNAKAVSARLVPKNGSVLHNDSQNQAQSKDEIEASLSQYPVLFTTYKHKQIAPRTQMQNEYVDAIFKNDIVFGIGPAGTGKTFLAVTYAVNQLLDEKIDRIVLTRPVIEAGEKLGFLPGDFNEKLAPYMRPLEDAFLYLIGPEKYNYFRENKIIEIVPLAYMRGRTLSNSLIILDEAQNSTNSQMFMFLTRMGTNAKIVITGDITQIDLEKIDNSGLKKAEDILKGIDGIKIINFSSKDVVRHPLVKKIIDAYSNHEKLS